MVLFQRGSGMSRVNMNIGYHLVYLQRQFNLSPEKSAHSTVTCNTQTNLEYRTTKFIWDFPPHSASNNQVQSAQQMFTNQLGTLVSCAVLWPHDSILLSFALLLNFFSFLQFHFHFSASLFHTIHWSGLCTECRDEHRVAQIKTISKCTHPKSCPANEIQEMKEQKPKRERRYDQKRPSGLMEQVILTWV